jgi:hypothetical protein
MNPPLYNEYNLIKIIIKINKTNGYEEKRGKENDSEI